MSRTIRPKIKITRKEAERRHGELLPGIKAHSAIVAKLAESIAKQAENSRNKLEFKTTPDHLYIAGLLHDITKAKKNLVHPWVGGKKIFPEDEEIAKLIGYHHFPNIERDDLSFDQKLLIYCDLRVQGNKLVTLRERFEELESRPGSSSDKKYLEYRSKEMKRFLGIAENFNNC